VAVRGAVIDKERAFLAMKSEGGGGKSKAKASSRGTFYPPVSHHNPASFSTRLLHSKTFR